MWKKYFSALELSNGFSLFSENILSFCASTWGLRDVWKGKFQVLHPLSSTTGLPIWRRGSTLSTWLSMWAPLHSTEGLGSQRTGQDAEIHLCEVVFSLPSTVFSKWISLWEDPAEHLLVRANPDEPRARELNLTTAPAPCQRALLGASNKYPTLAPELEMKFSCIWMWLMRFKQTITWRTVLSVDWSTFYLSPLVTRTTAKFISLLREKN